jgi:hypothetical protein
MHRNWKVFAGLAAIVLGLSAQTPVPLSPNQTPPQGTLSLTVVERSTKKAVERAVVGILYSNGNQNQSQTDVEGKVETKLPPGIYRLTIRPQGQTGFVGTPAVTTVNITLDQTTKTEVEIAPMSDLSGRVLDARGEPVQGAQITLMMPTYEFWSTNLVSQNTPFIAQTNDVGGYFLAGIPAGIPFRIYAETAPLRGEALATLPADPDLRRPILAATYYPNTVDASAATTITFREGQNVEGADIRMVQTKSYCASGHVLPQPAFKVRYTILVDVPNIYSGVWNGYGSFRQSRTVQLDDEGNARVCGLWPGTYKFTVQPQNGDGGQPAVASQPRSYFGGGEFTIIDKDITTLTVSGGPAFDWTGEVVVDAPLEQPEKGKINVAIGRVTTTANTGIAQSDIPGKFTIPNMHYDRNMLYFPALPAGWYVKSAMYGDEDLVKSYGRFAFNKLGTPLKITVSPKGARLKVKVTNEKGEPVPGHRVTLVEAGLATPQKLVARMWTCYGDEKGECAAYTGANEPPRAALAPGQYVVLAAEQPYNLNAAALEALFRALQTQGTRVKLDPGQTLEVALRPVTLR